ncbi:MAG: hypothetical protein JWR13_4462 [Mycobacterium sp.]|jgi:hypothetical protein|nr:hypothetical protein [Mycobacterium sp.]
MALMHLWRRPTGSPTSDLDFYLGVRADQRPIGVQLARTVSSGNASPGRRVPGQLAWTQR